LRIIPELVVLLNETNLLYDVYLFIKPALIIYQNAVLAA